MSASFCRGLYVHHMWLTRVQLDSVTPFSIGLLLPFSHLMLWFMEWAWPGSNSRLRTLGLFLLTSWHVSLVTWLIHSTNKSHSVTCGAGQSLKLEWNQLPAHLMVKSQVWWMGSFYSKIVQGLLRTGRCAVRFRDPDMLEILIWHVWKADTQMYTLPILFGHAHKNEQCALASP